MRASRDLPVCPVIGDVGLRTCLAGQETAGQSIGECCLAYASGATDQKTMMQCPGLPIALKS